MSQILSPSAALNTPEAPTSDERLMGALCHVFSLVVAFIFYATQKDRSAFIRRHAVQAMAFDILVMMVWLVVAGCLMLFITGGMLLGIGSLMATTEQISDSSLIGLIMSLTFAFPMIMPCMLVLPGGVIYTIKIIAAVRAFQGKDFSYPWMGKWVAGKIE